MPTNNLQNMTQEELIAMIGHLETVVKKLSEPTDPPTFTINGEWDSESQQVKVVFDWNAGLIEYLKLCGHTGESEDDIFYQFITTMLIQMNAERLKQEGKTDGSNFS